MAVTIQVVTSGIRASVLGRYTAMADKNTLQKQEIAITNLESGVEGLKISMAENKTNMASMDKAISKLTESNDEMKRNLSELMKFLKKDPPEKQPDLSLIDGEGSSNHKTKTNGSSKQVQPQPMDPKKDLTEFLFHDLLILFIFLLQRLS
ncbi:uncharacterized protein LOC141676558 [Apium graveolens]|uniref:uncharacterized protein LOC141676558 n=1 Tax=Apium graveolens TaxID=4045 RepID=UPI003D79033B